MGPIEFEVEQGLVLAVPRLHHIELALWLAAKGVKRIKLDVEGIRSHFTPFQATHVLLRLDTDIRLLVYRNGIARVFPRPGGVVRHGAVRVNGKVVDADNFAEWCAVWPSLRASLPGQGTFFCEEPNDLPNSCAKL
ncbi:MAG: hypothetical protein ACPG4T_06550 [Nannocystaceae bacterium]